MRYLFVLGFFLFQSSLLIGQANRISPRKDTTQVKNQIETIEMVSTLDPLKSAIYSAVLPGLGQVYNGESWKLPIVISGGMVIGHLIGNNHQLYTAFNNAMIADLDNSAETVNPFPLYTSTSLQRNRDFYRRNRDFMIILGIGYYLLNIVEAHIAAHLKEFSVNDDLSLKFQPSFEPLPSGGTVIGFGIAISL
jgi:hypothetical protein